MCGRTRCTLEPDAVARRARVPKRRVLRRSRYKARHNCHPGCNVPVVFSATHAELPSRASAVLAEEIRTAAGVPGRGPASESEDAAAGGAAEPAEAGAASDRVVMPMQWGLVPSFTDAAARPDFWKAFNARSESVAEKPMFRRLVNRRRCAVLVDGFYEWKEDEQKEKQPYFVTGELEGAASGSAAAVDGEGTALALAGLFDVWHHRRPAREGEAPPSGDGPGSSGAPAWVEEEVWTVTLLTRPVAPRLAWLHNRMPVFLADAEALDAWLGADPFADLVRAGPVAAALETRACPPLSWHPVSKAMNSVKFVGESASHAIDLAAAKARAAKQKITNFFGAAKPRAGAIKPAKSPGASAAAAGPKGGDTKPPAIAAAAAEPARLVDPSSPEDFAEAEPVDADVFLSVRLALVGAVLEDADPVAWTVRLEDVNNTAASVTNAIDGWRDLEDVAVDTFLLLREGRLEVTLVDAPCSRSACLANPHCDWDECVRAAETSTAAVPPRADETLGGVGSPQEWDRLLRMRLALPVRSLIVGTLFSQCADWIIDVEWEVGGGACTATAVPSIASYCDAGGKDIANVIGRRFGWLDLLVIALALAYSALLLLRAFRQLRTFWQVRSWAVGFAKGEAGTGVARALSRRSAQWRGVLRARGVLKRALQERRARGAASASAVEAAAAAVVDAGPERAASPLGGSTAGSSPDSDAPLLAATAADGSGAGGAGAGADSDVLPEQQQQQQQQQPGGAGGGGGGGRTKSGRHLGLRVTFSGGGLPGEEESGPRADASRFPAAHSPSGGSVGGHSAHSRAPSEGGPDAFDAPPGASGAMHSPFVADDDDDDSDDDDDDDNDDKALARAAGAADPKQQVAVLAVPGCLACVRAVSPVWTISAASGALLTAAASVITLAQGGARHPGPTLHGLCLGIGSFLLWMSALRYLEFSRATYGIVLTLQRAAPRVLVFVAGALPLLFAYAAFGVAFFGDTVEGFSGPRQACVTLFSVLNGDVILDTFASLMGRFPFVGQVYVYSFVSLFIYVVLNVLIALVEEAFFQSSAETSAILERQRSKQGLSHRMPGSGGSAEQAAEQAAAGVDLDSVDLLAQNPRDDLDALQSQASGARDAWRTALRLKEWDEVASNAGSRFR
ncbi:hypothetical protein FNF27_07281 [Cafeteria roenbergensis]|uniref:Polycystin cation channel PKD1/PKD2 domain-containing protein n=1 Tax=Cafeteria roenbergensis TaxID=33653 RepID=A0A5A8DQ78_CAFRO|nr:hypothetical protein FNF27_07281 [Cafeteria roenbergensis]